MSAIDFPANPTTGQEFTAAGLTWVWDGAVWRLAGGGGAAGGVIIGDPANPPADLAVGQLLFGPGGPPVVLTGWTWRASGNLVAPQMRPNSSVFANMANFQFFAQGPDGQPSFPALADLTRPGDRITVTFEDGTFASYRVLYQGSGWQFGTLLRGTWVWIDTSTFEGTITAWPTVVDQPVTVTISPNIDESALWLMTDTGLVRAEERPPVSRAIPTFVARAGSVVLAKTASTAAGAIPTWTFATGMSSSDPEVFANIDDSRVRILQPGRYTIELFVEWALNGSGAVAPAAQRNGNLSLSLWRVPAGNAIGDGQVTVTTFSFGWFVSFRGAESTLILTPLEVLAPQDLYFRASENSGVADTWSFSSSRLKLTRMDHSQ